ncbi:MAG: hypothetical protein K5681_10245 [Treponema sp.]|nr:hypothetical protein [Treponema sp.]
MSDRFMKFDSSIRHFYHFYARGLTEKPESTILSDIFLPLLFTQADRKARINNSISHFFTSFVHAG